MKTETKEKIWFIILLLGLILFFATGCKPKEVLHIRTATIIDSTEVLKLKSEITKLTIENRTLKTDLERFREENIRLRSEVSKHEIKYNTDAPLKPDGYYPIASEVKTISITEYEKTIKEHEKEIKELNKELQQTATKNINLEQTVEKLTEENKDLRSKTTPTTGFNFKLFLWGMVAGIVLILFLKLKL